MARENKRKRDERRFGKSDLLMDRLMENPFIADKDMPVSYIIDDIAKAKKFNVDNVSSYMEQSYDDKRWDWSQVPCAKMPFNQMFIEGHSPEAGFSTKIFSRIGALLIEFNASDAILGVEACKSGLNDHGKEYMQRFELIKDRCAHHIHMIIFGSISERESRSVYLATTGVWVDKSGTILDKPKTILSDFLEKTVVNSEVSGLDPNAVYGIAYMATMLMIVSLAFMNCKNVSIHQGARHEEQHNRERRKHGLRPFLRYHTINIEPMKKILRSEGQDDTGGLSRALHICRGHFSHYSEEKPLFGKVAGTFWIPAHTRGSAKSGVVISDYDVNRPRNTDE